MTTAPPNSAGVVAGEPTKAARLWGAAQAIFDAADYKSDKSIRTFLTATWARSGPPWATRAELDAFHRNPIRPMKYDP